MLRVAEMAEIRFLVRNGSKFMSRQTASAATQEKPCKGLACPSDGFIPTFTTFETVEWCGIRDGWYTWSPKDIVLNYFVSLSSRVYRHLWVHSISTALEHVGFRIYFVSGPRVETEENAWTSWARLLSDNRSFWILTWFTLTGGRSWSRSACELPWPSGVGDVHRRTTRGQNAIFTIICLGICMGFVQFCGYGRLVSGHQQGQVGGFKSCHFVALT